MMGFNLPDLPDTTKLVAVAEVELPRMSKAATSKAQAVHRVADALERIAAALEQRDV
jgi:hypothetical protein